MKSMVNTTRPETHAVRWKLVLGILGFHLILSGVGPCWEARAVESLPHPKPAQAPAHDLTATHCLDCAEEQDGETDTSQISRGGADALVTLVEFVDYESTESRRLQTGLYRLSSTYSTELRLLVRHLPPPNDGTGRSAALAALAAARQGKYWDYRLLLFAGEGGASDEQLRLYARQVGLDLDTFDREREGPALAQVLREDRLYAQALGVVKAPALFLNGTRLQGTPSISALQASVERHLSQARERGVGEAPPQRGRTSPESNDAEVQEQLIEMRREMKELRSLVEQMRSAIAEIHRATVRPAAAPSPAADLVPTFVLEADDPWLGSPDAQVAIVEFSEFQCPFCKRFHDQTFAQLKETYIDTGKVRYTFRDFPLVNIHPQARPAAVAANCADKQGSYWEMHDALFAGQSSLGDELFGRLAAVLNLDAGEFFSCLSDPSVGKEIDADMASGGRLGVRGTPHFLIGKVENGRLVDVRRVVGAQPLPAFAQVIDGLLNE